MPMPRPDLFCVLHISRPWLILGMVLICINASAAEDNHVVLHIRPSICVSYDSEAPCIMTMLISWEAGKALDGCLFETRSDVALQCWTLARSGAKELEYANTVDVVYQLRDQHDNKVLAEGDIAVINRDLRSSRKRRRHVWSIL